MDGENWYVYCGNDPVNMVDPTGMWFGFTHREITEKAYNKIVPKKKRKAKEKGYLKSLKEGCTLPDEKRGEARRKEKETKYENHRYHGQKDYYKVMVEQIKKAKSKNTNKYKQIGIGLHALQDFYAHNVKLNGKIVKAKNVTEGTIYFRWNPQSSIQNISSSIVGINSKYISSKYVADCMKNKDIEDKNYFSTHAITADNPRAYFNGKKWVRTSKENNSRYQKAIKESAEYIKRAIKHDTKLKKLSF